MQTNTKAFTLVEMLVAMAVSTIIIAATYASYDLVATQYKKNIDVAEMHTSGRAVMQMIERDVRMAGFEYRDQDAKVAYGSITGPLVLKDSGDKCCDEVTVIYDYYDEDSKKVERIRITYSAGPHPRNKGGGDKYDRYRLYKQIDVLGRNNAILANPIIGSKDLLADFVEDFQIVNISTTSSLYGGTHGLQDIRVYDPSKPRRQQHVGTIYATGYIDALAFGPDGLLYGGTHGLQDIRVYDPSKPRRQQHVGTIYATGYIDALAFGPDGLLYGGTNGLQDIRVYDPSKPRRQQHVGTIYATGYIDALAFGPDGLLYGGTHGLQDIRVYDPSKPRRQQHVGTIYATGYIDALAFGPDGLLYGGTHGLQDIRVYDPSKPRRQQHVGTIYATGYIDALAFGPDGLLYGGTHGLQDIRVYDPSKPRRQQHVGTIYATGYIDALAFKIKRTGQESLVTINLTLRTRNPYGINKEFKKKDYHGGNFKFDKNDKYKRDTFSSTVTARNMAL